MNQIKMTISGPRYGIYGKEVKSGVAIKPRPEWTKNEWAENIADALQALLKHELARLDMDPVVPDNPAVSDVG